MISRAEWQRERHVGRTLRAVARQRVAMALQPGDDDGRRGPSITIQSRTTTCRRGAGQLDVGERDPAAEPAVTDGGEDLRIDERGGVPAALDAELHIVDRTRRIGKEQEFEIDRHQCGHFGAPTRQRPARREGSASCFRYRRAVALECHSFTKVARRIGQRPGAELLAPAARRQLEHSSQRLGSCTLRASCPGSAVPSISEARQKCWTVSPWRAGRRAAATRRRRAAAPCSRSGSCRRRNGRKGESASRGH
jgi:hypothetical protein